MTSEATPPRNARASVTAITVMSDQSAPVVTRAREPRRYSSTAPHEIANATTEVMKP